MVLCLLVVYWGVTVGYYHLPWSVRRLVYSRAPEVDRTLRRHGFAMLQRWDDWAFFGRDDDVELEHSYRADHAYAGLPEQRSRLFGRVRVLENQGYVTGYSDTMRNPLWVAYRLFDVPELEHRAIGPRKSTFTVDRRTRAQVAHSDYTHSGYDRGHMAPNYGIASRYGRKAQLETFLMSNVVPQSPLVNRHLWKDLEMSVAKRYSCFFAEVWVITGPVFEGNVEKLASGVPIPSAYYKIIADECDGRLRTLAFLMDQHCPPYTRIRKRIVSIDEIEKITGLDFFSDLPDDVENKLESEAASRLWPTLIPGIRYYLFGTTQ